MRRLIVVAALLALVATACKLETNFGTIINADGSGTVIAEIGLDDEAAELFLEGGDPFEGNEFADVPGARTREERRGDMTYYIIEFDVDDVTQAEEQLVDTDNSLLNNLDITVTDSLVSVSGTASADESLGGEAEGFDPSVFEDAISASVYFEMPGAITSHNADRQEGNRLYWDVPVLGGSLNIQAESDPTGTPASGGSDGFPTWAYVVIAAIVLAALYYFMKSRSGAATGGAGESSAAPRAAEEAPQTPEAAPEAAPEAPRDDQPPPPPPAE